MKIRRYRKRDLVSSVRLISKTFKKFNGNEGSKGVRDYIGFYTPRKKNLNKIREQFFKSSIFWVAVENNKIIGIVRGNPEKISNLFVDGKYHRKKLGTKLVIAFEKESVKRGSKLIKVAASLYATPFYSKMGYKKTTGIRNRYGLRIQPMQKKL